MEQILSDFGINPLLLAAQAVNFLVLLMILNRFLYKPLMTILEERRQRVIESLKSVEEIERKLAQIETDRQKILTEAGKGANEILKEATETGNQMILEAEAKASREIEVLFQKANAQIKLDRDTTVAQIRGEIANLVSEGLKVVTGKVLTERDKKEILDKSLKNLS